MPRPFLIACALAAALTSTAHAGQPVSKAQVLDAIRTFETDAVCGLVAPRSAGGEDPGEAVARASNVILKYSIESDDVVVDLGPDSVPWCDVKNGFSSRPNSGERGLLLAAYLAGSVKSQLQSGRQDPNPLPGWVSMLKVYSTMRIREGIKIPEVDALLAQQARGTLEAFAAEAVRRSAERLRTKYGAGAAADKQIVTASSQP